MAEDNNRTIIPGWVQIAALAAIILLVVKLCHKETKTVDTSAIQARHIEDSLRLIEISRRLSDSAAAIKERARINDSVMVSKDRKLKDLFIENRRLDSLYTTKWISANFPSHDTDQVIVPNEFIDDCQSCFDQLDKTTKEADGYRLSASAMQELYINQSSIDSQRIDELEKQKLRLNKDYNDMRIAVEVNTRSLLPRRKIKTGIAGMVNNKFLPNGIGPGLMYEDKKDRNYSIKALFGSGQPLYVVDIFVPFSLIK